jgi:hypothetical protein
MEKNGFCKEKGISILKLIKIVAKPFLCLKDINGHETA